MKFWGYIKVPDKPLTLPWNMETGESGWDIWHKEAKRKYPVRYFFSEFIPRIYKYEFMWTLRSYKYAVKDFFFPHNVLRIRTLPTRWTDRDTRMLHACFQLLTDYVKYEEPAEFTMTRDEFIELYRWEDKIDEERLKVRDTMHELYDWWLKHQTEEWCDGADEKEQEMLIKLIQIRRFLWT